ncbi:reductive dehalogenase [Chloroflexota bacterium]
MKRLTIDQWESEYIAGLVDRFDQQNTMSSRKNTDPVMKETLAGLSAPAKLRNDPGFTKRDYALRWSPRAYHSIVAELNASKPHPSHLSQAITTLIEQSNQALAYPYRPPEGVKTAIEDPQTATHNLKNAARFFGADLVGVCALDMRWVYSHISRKKRDGSESYEHLPQQIEDRFGYAVVLGFTADYEMLRYSKTLIAGAAHDMASAKMVVASALLSRFIHNLGCDAIDCNIDDVVITVPLAMQAGLGQLGRNGLLITPQYGPRVRLSAVLTDLPLIANEPIDFGVTEFCTACKKCAQMCPSNSIHSGERTTKPNNISNASGGLKWPQNGETCLMRAARDRYPCSTCITVCPYNKPYTRFHRSVRWLTDHARWADPFYIMMDNLFGYGTPQKADGFWENWKTGR